MSLRPPIVAVVALLVLAGAGLTAAYVDATETNPAVSELHHDSPAHARASGGHGHGGAGAYAWEGGAGEIPDRPRALLDLERRGAIRIVGDDAFNPANGVREGSGTYEDPFVISGWFVDLIHIVDTSKAFVIRENYVNDILILDWTGDGGYVHHNFIKNLRTNRNVERTGDPSSSVIEKNVIERVQELRHFDGELRHNQIGKEELVPLLAGKVVLNVAGLNGAGIHDNVIHGGVDMKLHGHHHGDSPDGASHNHGKPGEDRYEGVPEDHQVRYIDFTFAQNRIVDTGFGLRYNDLNHRGDDEQATSEQEPDLELPHVHRTRVTIADNVIEGATLRVAVLNADDKRHLPGEHAELRIWNNTVLKPMAGDGLVVQDVRNALVDVRGNDVERDLLQLAGTSAILLQRFTNVTIIVADNAFGDYRYGVRAAQFDADTTWTVGGNRGPVSYPVYWDDSVANPPAGHERDDEHEHDHVHDDEQDRREPAMVRTLFAPTRK